MVPSDFLVFRLRTLDLLEELDRDVVTNLDNLDPAFRSVDFDPGNRFSVPWATGTTGIGYDSTVFTEPPGWEVFLDETFQGRMTILDETRDAFGMALISLDQDPNTTDPAAIDQAADLLIQAKGVISGFDSPTYVDRLIAGELVCAQAYSSDIQLAREENPDLAFAVPEQGGAAMDRLALHPLRGTEPGCRQPVRGVLPGAGGLRGQRVGEQGRYGERGRPAVHPG